MIRAGAAAAATLQAPLAASSMQQSQLAATPAIIAVPLSFPVSELVSEPEVITPNLVMPSAPATGTAEATATASSAPGVLPVPVMHCTALFVFRRTSSTLHYLVQARMCVASILQ